MNKQLVVKEALGLKIKDTTTLTAASEIHSKLKTLLKQIEEEENKVLIPLKEALKKEKERFIPFKKPVEDALLDIRSKISAYQTEQAKLTKIEEDRIAKRVEKGTLKVETAINKLNQIKTPVQSITTDSGGMKFRTQRKLKITSEKDIPREYLIPNESKILENLKKGVRIGGCEIEEVMIPVAN